MILGIETATARLGVAVYEPTPGVDTTRDAAASPIADSTGLLRAAIMVDRGSVHDALLVPLCRDVVHRAGIEMEALTAIAVSAGPGSFTGLRIGMAAAKGFALGLGIPLRLVPTLDAAAEWTVRHSPSHGETMLAICLDARRDDVYAATYLLDGPRWRPVEPVRVFDAATLSALLPDGTVLRGDGASKVHAAAPDRFPLPAHPGTCLDAGAVAALGVRLLATDGASDAETCEPLYVREFAVHHAKNPFL